MSKSAPTTDAALRREFICLLAQIKRRQHQALCQTVVPARNTPQTPAKEVASSQTLDVIDAA